MNDATTKAAAEALYEIDHLARQYDVYEYGLPLHDDATVDAMRAAIESAIERARADAIEQAAKACEARIDEAEHKRATDRAREAMKSGSMRDQIDRLKHEAMVSVHNAVLQRSADAIRALGTTMTNGLTQAETDASASCAGLSAGTTGEQP
jgi:hypothetical protein